MFNTILLATDGSNLSDRAGEAALTFAKDNGSKVVCLSVAEIHPYFPAPGVVAGDGIGLLADAIQAYAEDNVKKIAAKAGHIGVQCEIYTVPGWNVHDEIINAAKAYKCDLIFMASHGRKGLDKLLIGSETQKVLTYSEIPVLVYKEPAVTKE